MKVRIAVKINYPAFGKNLSTKSTYIVVAPYVSDMDSLLKSRAMLTFCKSYLPIFSPRSQKPHQIKKMLTFRTFLFRNCLQNSYIFIFVLESPHQMKKFLTFRTILFQNCLQISQFFIFVLKSRKKRLGSGGFRDWGRVTGNMNLFFLAL